MRKLVLSVFSLAVILLASCTAHRTCPTYMKNNDAPKDQISAKAATLTEERL